ncbi:MAG: hypothetical protein ACLFM0_04555 [Spirochaetales bacterium]
MVSFSAQFRDEIRESLLNLTKTSERIYLRLGEEFPALLSEMDRSVAESRSLARHVHGESGDGNSEYSSIDSAIAEMRQIISEGGQRFARMQEHDEALFGELRDALGRLGDVGSIISRIKEDSIEMELISLNAMTVALKSGSAGRAFSYITEELKRLSASTIEMTESIESRGAQLHETFTSFQREMEEAASRQQEVFSHAAERLEESFASFQRGLSDIAGRIETIAEEATTVKGPLQSIMEEVQLHDLVKQSVDHVLISLEELTRVSETSSTEEALDELTFFEQMPELCKGILDEVADRIRGSVALFREKSAEASRIVESLEKHSGDFQQTFIEGRTRSTDSIDALYEKSSSVLHTLLHDLNVSIRERQKIADHSRDLMKQVNRLNDDLRKFSVLVDRFRSVDVHSRIEVSKQAVLQEMGNSVEEMTELTKRIEADVSSSIDTTSGFMSSSSAVLAQAREVFERESDYVRKFIRRVRDRYAELNTARSVLSETVSGFAAFTGRFHELFEEAQGHHSELEALIETIVEVKQELESVRDRATTEKKQLLADSEYEQWSLASERLRAIIERFTIFTHKASAGELGGFEVEQGVSSGDVTLF